MLRFYCHSVYIFICMYFEMMHRQVRDQLCEPNIFVLIHFRTKGEVGTVQHV